MHARSMLVLSRRILEKKHRNVHAFANDCTSLRTYRRGMMKRISKFEYPHDAELQQWWVKIYFTLLDILAILRKIPFEDDEVLSVQACVIFLRQHMFEVDLK